MSRSANKANDAKHVNRSSITQTSALENSKMPLQWTLSESMVLNVVVLTINKEKLHYNQGSFCDDTRRYGILAPFLRQIFLYFLCVNKLFPVS